jgi:hypothetical protein
VFIALHVVQEKGSLAAVGQQIDGRLDVDTVQNSARLQIRSIGLGEQKVRRDLL